ncbi:nitrogenase molybdenum-iron protein subunit beta [Treponema sp. J25]|jgi:nitrogenase molybdenum-iron protein beta chain|uniref:nitrogenase molybdenum-iron protein subunit beta n=1 Tax=Treponema sp. J25 TaxID=2094121 RepID=UPI0010443D7F|nr:nitrogenase molybdenum-iron protein subunit beta [Treponema sp. J25]TCW61097.1 nitrogenase molybdenum-iron protein subunit beta [Treponema sp. J25]
MEKALLLKHTPAEVKERSALTVNPAKTCQPIGALYAALGIHRCLPHSHGSQGCCAYHRSMLTRHYREPVMASTSSFTEGASIFGGQGNLVQAIGTIFKLYDPDIIAVHTTCLSETIGDDIPQIISKAQQEGKIPPGKVVIHTNTPSYVGSHVTGFSNMVRSMVDYLAESTGRRGNYINLIPGWVEPADMREIKRILSCMGVPFILFPDTSGILDGPLTGKFDMYPAGGTRIEDLRRTGDAKATIALGEFASGAAAKLLDAKHKVPCSLLGLPLGLSGTDRFVDTLRTITGRPVPEELMEERGRLLDLMADMHQYTYGKKVALAGDPDQLLGLTEFLLELDMKVSFVVTGTPENRLEAPLQKLLERVPGAQYRVNGDLFLLHQWIKNERVDLLITNSHGKYIARDEDIPFVRYGFPIVDRPHHLLFPSVGYRGAMYLLEKILSVLMDRQDRDAPAEAFEFVL